MPFNKGYVESTVLAGHPGAGHTEMPWPSNLGVGSRAATLVKYQLFRNTIYG